jgi:hypothetical protein
MQWVLPLAMVNYLVEIIIGAVVEDLDLTILQIHQGKVVLVAAEMVPKQDKPQKVERQTQAVAAAQCAVMMHQRQVTVVLVLL